MAQRVMSAAGLVFKGSGFYITDYGKDGKKPQVAPESPKKEKPAEGAPGASATEAKPATAESKPAPAESKPAAPAKNTE